jgi:SAM-dependent methyltransferase
VRQSITANDARQVVKIVGVPKVRMSAKPLLTNCYDFPQYWDLAFRDETKLEADFFEAAARKYCRLPIRRLLEPGCGGGRLVVEMASRGYDVVGFDISPPAVKYLQKRLRRRGLSAEVYQADMTQFRLRKPVEVAFNTFNTFRHLTTEDDARQHLESVAASLRPGGIFVLGFHLLPPDADDECTERWTTKHGSTQVTTTLRVLSNDRRRRLEKIRFSLRVRSGTRDLRLRSDYTLRIYTAKQFRSLISKVPEFELVDVFDFWYELDNPLKLTDELGDAVFILRKLST